LLGIVMAYVLGRVMFDRWTGQVAAALLAAAPLYFGLSQVLVLDATLTALVTAALTCVWLAYAGVRRECFTIAAYAATALAVLTKGPTALLLPAVIIVVFLVLRRDLGALRWLCSARGFLVFAAIALPWYALVSIRNPEFLRFFVVKQHFDRFFRPDEHQQPLWFFVPIVLAGFLPWSAFVLLAPRRTAGFIKRTLHLRVSPATLYCVTWSAVIFAVFSCSRSKLGTYVLPMFCPTAILLARFFRSVVEDDDLPALVRGCVFVLLLGAAALVGAAIAPLVTHDPQVPGIIPSIVDAGIVLVLTAMSALAGVRRRHARTALAILLLGVLMLQAVAFTARRAATQYRAMGSAIRRLAHPEDLVVSYRQYVLGVNFYARHRVVLTGGRGELDFGSLQGDHRGFFWDGDDPLVQAWGAPRHVFLVIDRTDLEALKGRLLPAPREVAAQGKKVTVVNFN